MKNEKRLIDANEFLNRLENTVYDTPTDFGYTPSLVKTVLAQTKTVDAAPVVHGRWVLKNTAGKHTEAFHCSECDNVPRSHYPEKFCPNCGAKMDGERKDNEQA